MAPPVFVTVLHSQAVGFCRFLEPLVVVCIAATAILHSILRIEIVYQFVKQGSADVFNRPCKRPRADIDLMRPAQLGNPGIVTEGEVPICAGRGLNRDRRP